MVRKQIRTGAEDILGNENVKIHNILDTIERTFLPLGAQIGKYRIIEEIDRGGMAVVYKATQLDLDRIVALKVLPANVTINRRFVERFLSEAHAVAKLNHPNIVSIHEVSMENNIYFLAMEYIPGTNLYHFMNQKKPKLVEVVDLFVQIADALAYAHGRKILHRDLKLNNVIMRDNKVPVLIDFGLAKAMEGEDDGLTKTGEVVGSPAYMAPERILGSSGSDARSDICSLGIMLYELLTLKNPYLDPRSIHQTTLNVIEANPVPPRKLVPWLPPEVEAITLKAMHKDPGMRYQNMAELRDDLLRYQRGEQVLASPPSFGSRIAHMLRKNRVGFGGAAIILVFASLLLIVMVRQHRRERGRWRLIAEHAFDSAEEQEQWRAFGESRADTETLRWEVRDGTLQLASAGMAYLRLERLFIRDVRFEFDISGADGMLHDAGFFMCGDAPSSGYCFHIHRGEDACNGIAFPGSSFLFFDYDPAQFPASDSYHAVVEKVENAILFKLNGVTVGKVYDYAMPLGKNHQHIGFFVTAGRVRIDNLRIYRLAMPELASPTIIADRFREHGDFQAALDEYNELLLDISRQEMVHEIKLRMADCAIRRGDCDAAENLLSEDVLVKVKNESRVAYAVYLQGALNECRGEKAKAESYYIDLSQRFGGHPINISVAAHGILEALDGLSRDTVGRPELRIEKLTERYPRFALQCGRAHLAVLGYYAGRGMTDRARSILWQIDRLHEKNPDITAGAREIMARMYLGKRKKRVAVDLLNQAIAGHPPTRHAWRAWLVLGDVYACERNFGDAVTIYRKVYEECPASIPERWEARLRMGETAQQLSFGEKPHAVFLSVAQPGHPFPLSRLIARFYLDDLKDDEFEREYCRLIPDCPRRFYYRARKAMMKEENRTAVRLLDEYLKYLAPDSWEYVYAFALKQMCEKK